MVTRIARQAVDEAAVDLELVDRQVFQIGQRRQPGAEIVDRDRHTPVTQLVEQAQVLFDVVDQGVLGELDLQALRRAAGGIDGAAVLLQQHVATELAGRHVDGNPHRRQAVGIPLHQLAGGFGQHPAAQRHHQAGALGHVDEIRRAEQAALRVLPAHQRLGADGAAAGQLDDRLIEQPQLAAFDRLPQLRLDAQAVLRGGAQVGIEHHHLVLAVGLGAVHRQIGGPQHLAGTAAVDRKPCHADAATQVQQAAVEQERTAERFADPMAIGIGIAVAVRVGADDDELVAAEAVGPGARRQRRRQAPRHLAQQHVAGGMAERVVDLLEVVDVDRDH